MGSQLRLNRFDSEPEDTELRERIATRAMNRKVFREMVKGEVQGGRLSRRQRRELVQFAESLGLDTYEANLLLRAVEYECCMTEPAARIGINAPLNTPPLTEPEEATSPVTIVIALLTIVVIGAMAVRVLAAVWS